MDGSLRLGTLFGIPFYVHPSWFLVLGLMTLSFGGFLLDQYPDLQGGLPWVLGLIEALLLFASVLAHELGHSFVALRQGVAVQSITLFIFGGMARLEKESATPAGAFWVAIAGPLVSLVLFTLLVILGGVAAPLSSELSAGPTAAILSTLASINLILAVFNLIPGLPLDGGNILKAIVWKITGNPYKGIVFASRAGQVVGWVGMAIGTLAILGLSPVGSIWTVFIGWFLLQNAMRAAQSARVQERLSAYTVTDVMTPDSPIASAESSLGALATQALLARDRRWDRFWLTDNQGQLVGTLSLEDLKTIPSWLWPFTKAQKLLQPMPHTKTVQISQPLTEVVQVIEQNKLWTLPVVQENGIVVGIVEKPTIFRLLQQDIQA